MTAEEVLWALRDWFGQVSAAGLKLPSGWFGRPYDNLHRLSSAQLIADRLTIVLDEQMILMLARPTAVRYRNGNLVISGFDHCVWDWREYGSGQPHLETFVKGEIEFVKP